MTAPAPLLRQDPGAQAPLQKTAAKFPTFQQGSEEQGIDNLRVQEILSHEEPTRLVKVPSFIKVVAYLRGVIVPVVDSASDALALKPVAISTAPEMNASIDTGCTSGLASTGERKPIPVDIKALMASANMGLRDSARQM